MTVEPSKSNFFCQKNLWKTCVLCGDLNKQVLMRSFNKAMHLHVMVAYLKFTGYIEAARDLSCYDEHKSYECFVCYDHIEAPARAIRKIYSFTPNAAETIGKCDPNRLIEVLKQYMPPEYHNITIAELDDAIPNAKVPISREVKKDDCSCCNVLEQTRIRLKRVIENAEEAQTCVRLNFAVFEELMDIEKNMDIDIIENGVKGVPVEKKHFIQEAHERYLMGFENQKSAINKRRSRTSNEIQYKISYESQFHQSGNRVSQIEPLKMVPYQASSLRHISILPKFPGIPFPETPLQYLLSTPKFHKSADGLNNIPMREFSDFLTERKRTNPLSTALIELSSSSEQSSPKKLRRLGSNSAKLLSETDVNVSQSLSSSSGGLQDQHSINYAQEIVNARLVVFSSGDLNDLFPEKNINSFQDALSNLESSGLLYSHVAPSGMTVYIKEIRREYTKELWSYGIIPEHYRQRLIGLNSTEIVRSQFEKYKKVLIEMNCKPKISELIGIILSESNNSELEIVFGKFKSGSTEKINCFSKKRAPKLDP